MKKYFLPVLILLIIVGIGFGIWTVTKPKAQAPGDGGGMSRFGGGDKSGPVPVKVETVQRRAIPLLLESVGSVESEHSVEVRPQVTGVLREVLFEEGQHVAADQILFKLDPATAEADVKQAQATLARDGAQARQTQEQAARLAPLAKQEYVTRQEYDQARAAADAAAATVAADRAQLEQAKIQLGYTLIRAPIAGRTGSLTVRSGNLVGPGNALPLVTINQIKPALVKFSIPQQNLDELRRYNSTGSVKVEILREDKTGPVLGAGHLVFIDNNVNAQNGTITLKARIPNADEVLLPGQFIAVRMVLTVEPNAVVVPEAVVQQGQQGPYVYVIVAGKAHMQPIVIARQVDNLMVISTGLQGGEAVITEFPRNLAPGMPVKVTTADQANPSHRTNPWP